MRLLLCVIIYSALLFAILVSVLNICAKREILSLLQNLERATSLKTINSLMTFKGDIREENTITDRQLIESLTNLLKLTDFRPQGASPSGE